MRLGWVYVVCRTRICFCVSIWELRGRAYIKVVVKDGNLELDKLPSRAQQAAMEEKRQSNVLRKKGV
jgi:hypothetical protein